MFASSTPREYYLSLDLLLGEMLTIFEDGKECDGMLRSDIWTRRFIEHVSKGRLDQALESITEKWYEKGLEMGEYYWRIKKPVIAEWIYEKLTEQNESHWKSWQNRGILLAVLERFDEALLC